MLIVKATIPLTGNTTTIVQLLQLNTGLDANDETWFRRKKRVCTYMYTYPTPYPQDNAMRETG